MQIELTLEKVATLAVGIAVLASAWTWWKYNVRRSRSKLRHAESEEAQELSSTLLARYRELYELEKGKRLEEERQCGEEMKALRGQIEELRGEMDYLRHRQEEMQIENEKIRALNVKLQEEARLARHEAKDLAQANELLRTSKP